jgi:glycosyltransferase involved in cell wall biosynthesis
VPSSVEVFPYSTAWSSLIAISAKVFEIARGSYLLLFLPNSIFLAIILPLLKRRARLLASYLSYDYAYWAAHSRFGRLPLGSAIFQWLNASFLGQADFIIARGKYLCDLASQSNKTVHDTVPISDIDYSVPPPNQPAHLRKSDCLNILVVAKLQWSKGFSHLVEAAVLLSRTVKSEFFHFHIAGDGPQGLEIRNRFRSCGVENVTFHGWLDGTHAMLNVWQTADLFVHPSASSEGIPRVIDEALYFGIPVIATALPSISVEFHDEIELVPPGNSDALCHAIMRHIPKRTESTPLPESAARRIETFSSYGSAGDQHSRLILNYRRRE